MISRGGRGGGTVRGDGLAELTAWVGLRYEIALEATSWPQPRPPAPLAAQALGQREQGTGAGWAARLAGGRWQGLKGSGAGGRKEAARLWSRAWSAQVPVEASMELPAWA